MDSSGKLTSRDATEMLNPKKMGRKKGNLAAIFTNTHTSESPGPRLFPRKQKNTKGKTCF